MDALPSDLFAKRLRFERERAGIDARELSSRITARLGGPSDPGLVSRIEDRTLTPRLDEAATAAEELGISLAVMIAAAPDEAIDREFAALSAERLVAEALRAKADAAADRARQDLMRIDQDLRVLSSQRHQAIDVE
ncbi:hypothetical protein GCM10022261_27120 [Brevibacterium daeguense]|uniref:HTH cro/C1-type domain-containing protein n=1 Tax=Brevibacterium daeguense TaxID=909936 RepID=A0ABP8EMH0_9MICO|nr:hypothetical protein [Brevibacterium daeguense]